MMTMRVVVLMVDLLSLGASQSISNGSLLNEIKRDARAPAAPSQLGGSGLAKSDELLLFASGDQRRPVRPPFRPSGCCVRSPGPVLEPSVGAPTGRALFTYSHEARNSCKSCSLVLRPPHPPSLSRATI